MAYCDPPLDRVSRGWKKVETKCLRNFMCMNMRKNRDCQPLRTKALLI